MTCPIGLPALARCALDGTLRTSTSNRCSLSCSSRCFQRCPACSCSWNTATTRSGRWWRLHFLHSTGSVDAPRARVARIARVAPHTIHTHTITQLPPRQPSRRRAARLGRSGAAEQRAIGGGAQGRVRALVADHPRRRWWTQQRRATSSSASRCRYEYGNDDGRLHQGKGSARASHPEAGPAHIRATSLPLSVPRRSLLSRSYLGWGIVPPFSSWRVFAEGAACG